MDTSEINAKKRSGDYILVGQMLGMTRHNVRMTLKRVRAKKHEKVKACFAQVIEAREKLIGKNSNKPKTQTQNV